MRGILFTLSLFFLTTSCSGAVYVFKQAQGQLEIFRKRQRIDTLLARPSKDLSPKKRALLSLVLLARKYAFETIGLTRTAAFTRFVDTGGRPVAYNLSASPKDALKPHRWQFPIVGKVPYLGFFEEAQGRQQKRILEEKNLDTYLRPVSAYSSLGFFADPIYSPMLGEKPDRLVEIVIHESTHTTIFLRNEVDFNESLAVFVGQQGTLNFLARLAGPHAPIVLKAHARFSRRQRFGALVAALRDRLNAIYRSPLPFSTKVARRESIFAWAKDRYRHLFPGRPNALFLRRPLNNAVVLSLGRYLAGVNFHRQVYRCVNRDLAALVSLYKRAQAYRHPIAWAARRCHLHLPAPQHE